MGRTSWGWFCGVFFLIIVVKEFSTMYCRVNKNDGTFVDRGREIERVLYQ